MRAALDFAENERATTVWLAVWQRNARAIAFYEKHGFHCTGTQPFLLGSDLQTDDVMVRKVQLVKSR
jgi:diamine N-acetyltransferase